MSEVFFSMEQEEDAEFWAWLIEGYVVPEPLTPKPIGKTNQKLRVISIMEIKQLITDALDKNDQSLVNNLLNIASQPQLLSDDLLRKSMRVENGEYIKLLYVKLLEKTSFSDVIVRMLIPYAKDFLASFKSQHECELGDKGRQRLNHLISLIDSWLNMSPESRSRALDMGVIDYERTNELSTDYPYKVDDIKTALSDFIFDELERKLFEPLHHRNRVYDEFFKREWMKELSDNFLNSTILEASIDVGDVNRVLFTPKVILSRRLTAEDQENLLEKYGDRDIADFLRKFKPPASGNETAECDIGFPQGERHEIPIHREVSLPPCAACIKDRVHFEVEDQYSAIFSDRIEKDLTKLNWLIEALGKRIDIKTRDFFAKEHERMLKMPNVFAAAHSFTRSDAFANFLKIATGLAKTTDDFLTIKEINSIRTRIGDYGKIQDFVTDLVKSSIKHRSVVSFYVSKDVWRFLPQVIKGKDWITIAGTYLASRGKSKSVEKSSVSMISKLADNR